MKLTIVTILVVSFLVISTISIGIGSYFLYHQSEEVIKQEAFDHLITATTSRSEHIKTYIEAQEKEIELMSTSIVIGEFLAADKNSTDYQTKKAKAQQRLDETIKNSPDYEEVFIIDTEGKVILSTNNARVGTDKTNNSFFTEGKKKTAFKDVYYSEVTLKPQFGVSSPMLSNKKELLGVYAVRINLEKLNEIITENSGLGKTGEILILNQDSIMITPSKYLQNTVLSLKVDTELSRECLLDIEEFDKTGKIEEHEGEVMIYNDYRGVKVIGSHDFALPFAKWCVIAKVDEEEALGEPRNKLLSTFIIFGIVLIILTILIIFFVSNKVGKSVRTLSEEVEKISKGDLSIQLKETDIKEVSELTDSLSRVLASMKLAILRSGLTKEQIGLGEAISAKKEAEQKFSAIAENARDAIIMADNNDKIVFWNKAATEMFGYDAEEVMGKELHSFIPAKAEHQNKKDNLRSFGETGKSFVLGKTFELQAKKRNGETITVELSVSGVQIGEKWHAIGIIRDITERKKMIENQEQFKLLYETSQDAIMTLEPPSWNFTAGNPATIKLFGAKDEKEFTSKTQGELSPKKQPDGKLSSEKAKAMIEKAMKEGKATFNWTHKTIAGKEFPAIVQLTKVKTDNKEFLQATVRDQSKERNMEEELKCIDTKYKNLFDSARDGIVLLDLNAKILDVNNRIEEYGYKKSELLGKNQLNYIPKKYWPQITKDNAKTAKGEPSEGTVELITPKGNVFVEYHTNAVIENGKVTGGQVILREIKDKKTA